MKNLFKEIQKLFISLFFLLSGATLFAQTWGSNNPNCYYLNPTGGYFGIGGTPNTLYKLYIQGNLGVTGTITGGSISGNGSGLTSLNPANIAAGTYGSITSNGNISTTTGTITGLSINAIGNIYAGGIINGTVLQATSTTGVNYINGTLGIGTYAVISGYKLAVNGGIIAEEVKVITDVPASDYVFEPDYKLTSLTEVEQYVKTNKHLEGIPSAEEFKKNGYSVGTMDNMLLKTVEEMMLHLIDLEKENKRLASEIETLKNK